MRDTNVSHLPKEITLKKKQFLDVYYFYLNLQKKATIFIVILIGSSNLIATPLQKTPQDLQFF